MAATKLSVYQAALRHLGDHRLATITDDVEARYVLDDAWTGAVEFVLRQAPWRFALKTSALVAGGTVLPSYSNTYTKPADWLRTHGFFVFNGSLECPVDIREQGVQISANVANVYIRYISSDYADPGLANNPWPEHFTKCVEAFLAFTIAEKITGGRGAAARMSQVFSSLLPEAISNDAVSEDRWLPHQRSGNMLRAAREILRLGFWRFALKTAAAGSGGTPATGYTNSFTQPSDWLRTHALFLSSSGREFPFDVREHGSQWSANVTAFTVRYVSSTLGLDTTQWREGFMKALLAFLEADDAGDKEGGAYPALLAAALETESEPPNKWLPYQLDGTFLPGARSVLTRGNWWWALKETQIDVSQQLATQPEYGFPHRYAIPSDWLKTHALFVPWDGLECPINIRESSHDWSTDATTFVARYLPTSVLNANGGSDITKAWPDLVGNAVLAYLDWQASPAESTKVREAEFNRLLTEALVTYGRPDDEWLRFQLDGRFEQARKQLIEQGRWRFAIKTVSLTSSSDPLPAEGSDGTVSNSYGYRFIKPTDWMRTVWVYYLEGTGLYADRGDIDYRDEGGAIHANYTPITLRYVSRLGLESSRWPANFRDAVLLWLKYSEARADPKMVGQAQALLDMFEQRCREVERLDDSRDRPQVRNTGRFVAARYGRSGYSREQGWPQ